MDIIKKIQDDQIDYTALMKKCVVRNATIPLGEDGSTDFNIIIPVRERAEFNRITTSHLIDAFHTYNNNQDAKDRISIKIIISEYSNSPQHRDICRPEVHHLWVPSQGNIFNKCIAHNVAALVFPETAMYLFHDVDILVPKTYFDGLVENWVYAFHQRCRVLQTFTARRLLQCTHIVTKEIFAGQNDINNLHADSGGITVEQPGAAGGSMLIDKAVFFDVGGFDPELFSEYSVEDQFFFDKCNIINTVGFCDNPPIELFHLWHPPAFNRITKDEDWDAYHSFEKMNKDEKCEYIKTKSELFKRHCQEPIKQLPSTSNTDADGFNGGKQYLDHLQDDIDRAYG